MANDERFRTARGLADAWVHCLTSHRPHPTVSLVRCGLDDRGHILFGAAAIRGPGLKWSDRQAKAVEAAELAADGGHWREFLSATNAFRRGSAEPSRVNMLLYAVQHTAGLDVSGAALRPGAANAWYVAHAALAAAGDAGTTHSPARKAHVAYQAGVLASFARPDWYRFDPAWVTTTTVGLAESVYEGRKDRLPILADALEDVGFPYVELLSWYRSPNPAWCKGEWGVDHLTGRRNKA